MQALSDEKVLKRLDLFCRASRRIDASILSLLLEVEDRRLHLEAACPTMFDFCRKRLGLSEGQTQRRLIAARLIRRLPQLLVEFERGRLTFCALAQIRDDVNETNVDELVSLIAGKSKREIEEILASRHPRPAVPDEMRKLPAARFDGSEATPGDAEGSGRRVGSTPARMDSLGAARFKMQLTVSASLRDKVERAKELIAHRNPSGDLAAVVEAAFDALLADLEHQRLGTLKRPTHVGERPVGPIRHGAISRATRRAVFERDGQRCTFASASGDRCSATRLLELDHVDPRARGGAGDVANLRVRCRAHNQWHAEKTFGRAHVAKRIAARRAETEGRRSSEAAGVSKKRSGRVERHSRCDAAR